MASLLLQYGFPPTRWTKAVQIMLEKKPGHPLLNRLRGIITLEADYNWVLHLVWGKRLFHNAANSRVLMTAQQARPGFQSISAAQGTSIQYNTTFLQRQKKF